MFKKWSLTIDVKKLASILNVWVCCKIKVNRKHSKEKCAILYFHYVQKGSKSQLCLFHFMYWISNLSLHNQELK